MTYRGLALDGLPVLVLGGDAVALAETTALVRAGAQVGIDAATPCDGLHDLLERGIVSADAPAAPVLVVVTDRARLEAGRAWGVPVVDAVPPRPPSRGGSGRVVLVGGGPGDPGLLTRRGYEELARADVVVTDRLAPLAALEGLSCEVVDVAKVPRGRFTPQERINAILVEQARAGRRVVRLKGGDPFVFGRGMEEVVACREAGVEVDVVPGVTSGVAVPELAGIPVTHRGVVQGFTVVSGHVAPDDPRSRIDWAALARSGTTLVVLMGVGTLPAIARALVDAGLAAGTPLACVMDGGLPSQSVVATTLGSVASTGTPEGVRAPAVAVIGGVAAFASGAPA